MGRLPRHRVRRRRQVHLQSRNGKPLTRYFPELRFPEGRYILDGEIVLFDDQGRQDFDALGQRIHPAKSRIDMLAEKTPTRFIAFDVLARRRRVAARAAPARAPRPPRAARRGARRPHAGLRGPRRGAAVAAGRRGRDRQAPGRALPAGRARRDGEDQARADDRRGRPRLAAGQGGGHARLAPSWRSTTPRATCARSGTAPASPPSRSASCRPSSRPTRRASASRRAEPLERRARAWTARCCGPSSSSRSPSTTPATSASATARSSCAGATTRPRDCLMDQLDG